MSISYHIELSGRARKEIFSLPNAIISILSDAIDALATDPRPQGVKKLSGVANGYRIRKGNYRILYLIDDTHKMVKIFRIGHRREVYRRGTPDFYATA